MFGLFKKKKPVLTLQDIYTDPKRIYLIQYVCEFITFQLVQCKDSEQKFVRFIDNQFTRGYFAGITECAFSINDVPYETRKDRGGSLMAIYTNIFSATFDEAFRYSEASMALYESKNENFMRGLQIGGQELLDFENKVSPDFRGLTSYFHNEMP